MSWWNDKAGSLQLRVKSAELDHANDYSDEELRRAVMHAREDIVLLVGHMDAVNTQLWAIKMLLASIAVLLLIIVAR